MPTDPALIKATEEAKKRFAFSDPENFFENIDKCDPVAFSHAKDAWHHARLVESEMIKILRERVEKCYARDPVNHKQNCRRYSLEYLGAWQNYMRNKAYLRTEGGNIDRFKPTLEELKNYYPKD